MVRRPQLLHLIATIAILLAWCFDTSQAVELGEYSARVSIEVRGHDELTTNVLSYLSRELRSLGDVVVTDEDPKWKIDIVVTYLEFTSGERIGVLLSVVVIKPLHVSIWESMIKEDSSDFAEYFLSTLSELKYHWATPSSIEELRESCYDIVAIFDTSILEPDRRFYQKVLDLNDSRNE